MGKESAADEIPKRPKQEELDADRAANSRTSRSKSAVAERDAGGGGGGG